MQALREMLWLPHIEEKIEAKHGLPKENVEQALFNDDPEPEFNRVDDGKYIAYCLEPRGGDYIVVVFATPQPGVARIVTARRMDAAEKSRFQKRRGQAR